MRYAILTPVVALILATTAQAHMLRHPKRMTASQQYGYALRSIAHARSMISWARRDLRRVKLDRRRTLDSTDPDISTAWRGHVLRVKLLLRDHLWLLGYGRRLLARAEARLLPAHYAGWQCIHLGPSLNLTGPHEGSGRNGQYSGPLQMSSPWMGIAAPNGSWDSIPVVSVYRVVERVAAARGFAYSFMAQQWPNTYPPCAGRFG